MSLILSRAILKTLIYADLFDYPLTEEEIWERIIKVKSQKSLAWPPGQAKVKSTLQKLKLKCLDLKGRLKTPPRWPNGLLGGGGTNKYYFLKGREHIVSIRKRREKYSKEKLRIAKEITILLRFIPTIKLISITGALAINNAKEDDDIDLFIVTSAGLLWTTRLLATFLIEVTGRRRHPGETDVKNKICLNMFVDEEHLSVPSHERDLSTAHEVAQMKPLYEKDGTYQKFLQANLWVKNYLPNAIGIKNALKIPRESVRLYFSVVENLFKNLQLWYMRKRRTTEVITNGIIRFHPQDRRKWVLKRYNQRLINLGL